MDVEKYIDDNAKLLIDTSYDLWNHPEVALKEERSAKLLEGILTKEGFSVTTGLAGMETAFRGEYGSGKPVIAILGEFDALPKLSQKVCTEKVPVESEAPGHGCGHNLLGTASLGAALAIKTAMEENGTKGTVIYFGCPAEEIMTGKIRMAAAGCFDELDAAISWHPWNSSGAMNINMAAMNTARFSFYGTSAHAAAAPEQGRSALDAVELMNVGVNYLREHVRDGVRIHYTITDGGGEPNVVPPKAESWYFIRAPKREEVDDTFDRICDIARGAALMTGTKVEIHLETGCWDLLHNDTMLKLMDECLNSVASPKWTAEEEKFARELTGKEDSLPQEPMPLMTQPIQQFGSTDVADVSYIVPTEQIVACTAPAGIGVHTWQFTACTGSTIGQKGMLYAAKVLAITGLRLMTDKKLLAQAKADFLKAKGNIEYKTVVPKIFY